MFASQLRAALAEASLPSSIKGRVNSIYFQLRTVSAWLPEMSGKKDKTPKLELVLALRMLTTMFYVTPASMVA